MQRGKKLRLDFRLDKAIRTTQQSSVCLLNFVTIIFQYDQYSIQLTGTDQERCSIYLFIYFLKRTAESAQHPRSSLNSSLISIPDLASSLVLAEG